MRFQDTGILAFTSVVATQQLQCPQNAHGLGFKMLESNIARHDGLLDVANPTNGQIELGIFQEALRESIDFTRDTEQKNAWAAYLENSTSSTLLLLSNATEDAGFPLDRLSIGTSFIYQDQRGQEKYKTAISALQQSVRLQNRNANGGLWYFANPNNLSAYQNLSYLDGMYSYPTFAILSANQTGYNDDFGPDAALKQFQILYDICKDDFGLLKHGYDAIKAHSWSDPTTGASPVVWARALAWYTLGMINALEALQLSGSTGQAYQTLKSLLGEIVRAQLTASDRSLSIEGNWGVWQIVDHPGATFGGNANYVEASASCMTAYSFLKAVRLGLIQDEDVQRRATLAGVGIYQNVLQNFLIYNSNDTLSLNGTSAVASLAGDVDLSYYVTRPTVLNNLKGTSAFVLASLEVERVC